MSLESAQQAQRISRLSDYLHVWRTRLAALPSTAEPALRQFYENEIVLAEKKLKMLR